MSEIHRQMTNMGCTAKRTAFNQYCRKLIAELGIEYSARRNSIGVRVKKDQSVDVHYVSKNDVFNFIWSGAELNEEDKAYIFGKYPALEEIAYAVYDFRDIYVTKDTRLLENFIDIYSNSSLCSIKSFAGGLKLDIDAVKNSVVSELSNGFVEGINNKIKVIKRIMYGRAKLKLLSAKILHAF